MSLPPYLSEAGKTWGLNEGPRRGVGGPSKIRSIATPNVMAEFMNEQIHSQKYIDQEYVAKFSTVVLDSERELEKAKQTAKGSQVINATETAVIEQQAVLDYADSKISQYKEIEPAIYGLYGANGKSPFVNVVERAGTAMKFEPHHKIYISQGGGVYDIDNMTIATPRHHKKIHRAGQ